MATASVREKAKNKAFPDTSRPAGGGNVLWRLLAYAALALADVFFLVIAYGFLADGNTTLAVVVTIIVLGANIVFFIPKLYPIRWMVPGLIFATLLVIYPIYYTSVTAFTNMKEGNRLSKDQAIQQIIRVGGAYVAEGGEVYDWDNATGTYISPDGSYALWLTREVDGVTQTIFAPANAEVIEITDAPAEPPAEYEGYTRMERRDVGRALRDLQALTFGAGERSFGIISRDTVAMATSRFIYDSATDTILDQETGTVYTADGTQGVFSARVNNQTVTLSPGYQVFVGFDNFARMVNDPALSGPLIQVFIWTVAFAALSVITTFAAGLIIAMVLNDKIIPGRKIIRSVLLIPYAIPGVISIVIWRGMLNQNLGIINQILGTDTPWLNDVWLARVSLVIVNLWLGYPYMMLICSGALQSIPQDVYEAAAVDGASPWQRFWNITFPLLLVAVGPLLISSFVFNFNNYLIVTALTQGNPPFLGSPIPAGQTDILISYVYKTAFSNQAQYGYASAITIVIFFIVAAVTLVQYRFTRSWEQVSENV